jgi:predicted AAA+ superfamily ATPase
MDYRFILVSSNSLNPTAVEWALRQAERGGRRERRRSNMMSRQ